MTREEFLKALEAALGSEDVWSALRTLLLDALAKGKERRTLLNWLDEARDLFPSSEDAILDAMDQLEEWSGPHARL
jgi:hypothetical protein